MRAAHVEAFMAWLQAGIAPDVHDSDAPLTADGQVVHGSYVIVFDTGPDSLDEGRVTASQQVSSPGNYRFVTRSVGVDPFAARRVRDAVAARLTGVRLEVAGRVCQPIYLDPSNAPVKRDTSLLPPLYFIEDDWIVPSDRA
ncbi:MAG TPA: hypothetical protein VFU07_07120 [Candidatus Lumbricidophila sp.]|nr:hypothetical protein [Candidatus Lumbricidophila sp.]